jgi:hypothetical protein
MSQTTYTIDQPSGSVGFIADASFIQDIESYVNAAGAVTYGCVVTRGASTDLIVHPDAAAEITDEKVVRGIVAADPSMESKEDGLVANYPVGSVVNVMRKGRIWVIAENAITEGTSTVNVRYAAGVAGTQLGALRGAAVVDETAVLPKSKWKSSTSTTGQLAIIEIDL